MQKNALVSVIVPVYKVEEYLHESVDSIINQKYKNLEIILVDDGSPDNCGKICDDYAKQDSRITVYHKENGGLSDARNYAIDRCNGEFITFVDSDDTIKINLVAALMEIIEKYEADIAISPYKKFTTSYVLENTLSITDGEKYYTGCVSVHDALAKLLYRNPIFHTGAFGKIYRQAVLDGIRYPKGLLYEDLATTYRAFFKSRKIAFTSEELYCYRIREGSIMRQSYSPKMLSCIPVSRQLYEDISTRYPSLKAAAASRAFSANRNVYFMLPYDRKEERLKVWAEMKKYRKTVLFDPHARKRERLAVLVSYMGSGIFHMFSKLYKRYIMRV